MLATKISFMNEIANLAERLGADIEKVRWASAPTRASATTSSIRARDTAVPVFPWRRQGIGVHRSRGGLRSHPAASGGSGQRAAEAGAVRQDPSPFPRRVARADLRRLGLAFKPGTDDMREAPSRNLLEALWNAGCAVRAYDPAAMGEARRIYGERPDFHLCERPMEALADADALVIVTEWILFPQPRLCRHPPGAQTAGDLRRPQSVRSRLPARTRFRLLRHRSR